MGNFNTENLIVTVNSKVQLQNKTYIRYVEAHEVFLCARSLPKHATINTIYLSLHNCLPFHLLPLPIPRTHTQIQTHP